MLVEKVTSSTGAVWVAVYYIIQYSLVYLLQLEKYLCGTKTTTTTNVTILFFVSYVFTQSVHCGRYCSNTFKNSKSVVLEKCALMYSSK